MRKLNYIIGKNKNTKSKQKIKAFNKIHSKNTSQNRAETQRKAKMYKQVLKELENGNFYESNPEPFERLYKEAKQWSKAKLPEPMNIHTDVPQKTDREVLEYFTSKLTRKIPKFDPDHEQEYYLDRCAGGPYSNYKDMNSKFKNVSKAAIIIQNGFRKFRANKIYKRLKYERENGINRIEIKQKDLEHK